MENCQTITAKFYKDILEPFISISPFHGFSAKQLIALLVGYQKGTDLVISLDELKVIIQERAEVLSGDGLTPFWIFSALRACNKAISYQKRYHFLQA